ncbi:MAG: hypothetical protein IPK83_22260 [Planctomycetes bacterium]|nr:hypothetical protein [Planctomycetota bacterium]
MRAIELEQIDALAAPRESRDSGLAADRSLIELAERNHTLRHQYKFRLGNCPAQEFMCEADAGRLVFMTGHQPQFFHPGVWLKNAAAAHLAKSSGHGSARFLVVDSDVPGKLAVEWPDDSEPICRVGRVAVRSFKDWQSYEQIGPEASTELAMSMAALPERIDPNQPTPMEAFRTVFAMEGGKIHGDDANYVARWIRAMKAVDAMHGVRGLDYFRISHVMQYGNTAPVENDLGRAAWAFVEHLAMQAGHFAQAYNAALAKYRIRNGIRGTQHPIPDLQIDGERIELPFWSISPNGPRRRVFAEARRGSGVNLYAENEPIGEVAVPLPQPDDMCTLMDNRLPLSLRPRALAQTLFMRLFGCDLFIHGIGGAKYDTITDDIIRDFFQTVPPEYTCVSATLRLPVRQYGVTPDAIAAATRRTRDIRYNPQRYLDRDAGRGDVAELLRKRSNGIEASIGCGRTGQATVPHGAPPIRTFSNRMRHSPD